MNNPNIVRKHGKASPSPARDLAISKRPRCQISPPPWHLSYSFHNASVSLSYKAKHRCTGRMKRTCWLTRMKQTTHPGSDNVDSFILVTWTRLWFVSLVGRWDSAQPTSNLNNECGWQMKRMSEIWLVNGTSWTTTMLGQELVHCRTLGTIYLNVPLRIKWMLINFLIPSETKCLDSCQNLSKMGSCSKNFSFYTRGKDSSFLTSNSKKKKCFGHKKLVFCLRLLEFGIEYKVFSEKYMFYPTSPSNKTFSRFFPTKKSQNVEKDN